MNRQLPAQINNKGMTLVEVLVVMVIMGLVVTAIYGLFIDSNRTSVTTEEVVDVQQNLRIAMETMARDVRMAGFLIPDDDEPVETTNASLSDVNFLDLNLATSSGAYARITSSDVNISSGTAETLTVDSDMAAYFSTTDGVRFIVPDNPSTAVDLPEAEVTAVDTAADTITIEPTSGMSIGQGDMVVLLKADDADNFPVMVRYQLVDDPDSDDPNLHWLQRAVNPDSGNAFQTVAENINSVTLTYLPSNTDIRAVQINIVASTDANKTGVISGVKTRSLQTVVSIRNRSGA